MVAFSVFSMLSLCVFCLCALSFYLFIYKKIHLFLIEVKLTFNDSFISALQRRDGFMVSFLKLTDMELLWAEPRASCMLSMCTISGLYCCFPYLLYLFCLCQPCFAIHNTFLKCNISVGKDCCFQTVSYFLAAYHFCTLFSCLEYSVLFLNSFL